MKTLNKAGLTGPIHALFAFVLASLVFAWIVDAAELARLHEADYVLIRSFKSYIIIVSFALWGVTSAMLAVRRERGVFFTGLVGTLGAIGLEYLTSFLLNNEPVVWAHLVMSAFFLGISCLSVYASERLHRSATKIQTR